MADVKKPKRRRLTHEQNRRLEALEESLFGGGTDAALAGFGQEAAQIAGRLPAHFQPAAGDAEDGAPLIIWEDRQPGGAAPPPSDSDSGSEEESEDTPAPVPSPQEGSEPDSDAEPAPAPAAEASDADSQDSEEAGARAGSEDGAEAAERRASGAAAEPSGARRPVWEDPDDAALRVDISRVSRLRKLREREQDAVISGEEYSRRLKQQHAKMNPRTGWAAPNKRRPAASADEQEEEERLARVVRGAGSLLGRRAGLPAGLLQVSRVRDANAEEPSAAVVQSVDFHPSGQLLLTAGLDRRLRFFQVDGVKNAKVQSIYLEDLPVHKAAFACGGSKVVASGRRKHFYVFDLAAAKVERVAHLTERRERSLEGFAASRDADRPLVAFLGARGYLPLVSLHSRQLVAQLKMPGSVHAATFSDDGTYLVASGVGGVVHTWDMRTRRCVSRFVDEGALRGGALASSAGLRFLAAGSDAGFVNVYDHGAALKVGGGLLSEPQAAAAVAPVKTLSNLTTAVDTLAFSPDGEILAMASRWKKDALRLVHTGSMSVFSNWPSQRTPVNLVHSLAFSPRGGFLAIGNAQGRALLYRLNHYSEA